MADHSLTSPQPICVQPPTSSHKFQLAAMIVITHVFTMPKTSIRLPDPSSIKLIQVIILISLPHLSVSVHIAVFLKSALNLLSVLMHINQSIFILHHHSFDYFNKGSKMDFVLVILDALYLELTIEFHIFILLSKTYEINLLP